MSEEDYDRDLEAVHETVRPWFDEFAKSTHFERLTDAQQRKAAGVIHHFTEYSFTYGGLTPAEWDRGGVIECCLETLPRKITAEQDYFAAVAPVLAAFFGFLAERSLLKNAAVLAATVADLGDDIVPAPPIHGPGDRRRPSPCERWLTAWI